MNNSSKVKLCIVARYVLSVFFALAPCFSSFAIFCFEDSEGEFHCFQEQTGIAYFLGMEDAVPCGTIGGGGCTNCSKMTPVECQQLKSDVGSLVYSTQIDLNNLKDNIYCARISSEQLTAQVEALMAEGDQFVKYTTSTAPGSTTLEKSTFIINSPGGQYLSSKTPTSSGTLLSQQIVAVGTVYNYYNQSVKPALEQINSYNAGIRDQIDNASSDCDVISSDIDYINLIVDSVSCEPCSNGSGSGSGGSGEGEGTGCGGSIGCDCLKCAQALIDFLKPYLDDLQEKVLKIQQDVNHFKEESDQYYAFVKSALPTLAYMGTNFVYATQYKDLDGITFQMKLLDDLLKQNQEQGFDFGEFGKLSWFSRVEYLLLSIAGVYSKTNDLGGVTKDDLDDAYDGIADRESTLENTVDSVSSKFNSVHNSLRGFYSSFKSGIGSGNSSGTIRFFSDWIGDAALEIQVDSTLIDGCRACTSLVWSVGFFVLLYDILFWGWRFLATAVWFWVRGTTAFVK